MSTIIETYSGRRLDYLDPRADAIDLSDIAHALSFNCRFGGHIHTFYSVAEHAVLVAKIVAERTEDPLLALAALHHDDHEAYLGDIPTPLKRAIGPHAARIAFKIDLAVAEHLGINSELFRHPEVKAADEQALWIEGRALRAHMDPDLWGAGPECPRVKMAWEPVGYGASLFLDTHAFLAQQVREEVAAHVSEP